MCRSARFYSCARCHDQVIICSHCDRGQRYCSAECAEQSRLENQRAAGARYQSNFQGRQAHARRQRHYRQRQREKVTHQGSPDLSPYDVLVIEPEAVTRQLKQAPWTDGSSHHCHFCGDRCDEWLRWAFLHRPHSTPLTGSASKPT